jgi:hypothetical protein
VVALLVDGDGAIRHGEAHGTKAGHDDVQPIVAVHVRHRDAGKAGHVGADEAVLEPHGPGVSPASGFWTPASRELPEPPSDQEPVGAPVLENPALDGAALEDLPNDMGALPWLLPPSWEAPASPATDASAVPVLAATSAAVSVHAPWAVNARVSET